MLLSWVRCFLYQYSDDPFVIQSNWCSHSSPSEAVTQSIDVLDGDIIVVATDGLFDNMTDSMILGHLELVKVSPICLLHAHTSFCTTAHRNYLLCSINRERQYNGQPIKLHQRLVNCLTTRSMTLLSPWRQLAMATGSKVRNMPHSPPLGVGQMLLQILPLQEASQTT